MAKEKPTSAVKPADVKADKALKDAKIMELENSVTEKGHLIEEQDDAITSLKKQVTQKDAKITELENSVKQKDVELTEAKNLVVKQNERISELTSQAGVSKEKKKPSYQEHEFTVDKFSFQGTKYTSEDAVKDCELMESLIEAKFFGLKKTK